MTTRYPAVAGSFYPEAPGELHYMVQDLLAQAIPHQCSPKALIAPHAGYIYSGKTAATAYSTLQKRRFDIKTVVILGPSHRVGFRGIAAPENDVFETPLGEIDVDTQLIERAQKLPQVSIRGDAHRDEHSIEVQLPFLQAVLDSFKIVPFVVGDANAHEVAELLELLWGDDETLIVISSDLSHFHPYQCAQILDAATSHEIEQLHPVLSGEQACGCRPLNGLLESAQQHHLKVTTLDVRNSGDTAGTKEGVVGYGAFALQ